MIYDLCEAFTVEVSDRSINKGTNPFSKTNLQNSEVVSDFWVWTFHASMGWIPSWFDWLQHKKVCPPFAWISNKSHWVWSHSHLSLGLPSFFRSIGLIYVALVTMGLFCGMSVVPAIPDMLQSAKWESVSFIFFGIVLLSDHKQAFSCILSIMGSYVAVNKNLVWPLENVTVKQAWHSWDISIYFYEVTNLGVPSNKRFARVENCCESVIVAEEGWQNGSTLVGGWKFSNYVGNTWFGQGSNFPLVWCWYLHPEWGLGRH